MRKTRTKKPPEKSKVIHQLYVLGVNQQGYYAGPRYCKAHIRNKRGYVYLQWKDSGQVKSMYLGKAPRSSPTAAGQIHQLAGGRPTESGKSASSRKVRQRYPRTRRGRKP